MKNSSAMYRQIRKAQRAMEKWPKELLNGIGTIRVLKVKP